MLRAGQGASLSVLVLQSLVYGRAERQEVQQSVAAQDVAQSASQEVGLKLAAFASVVQYAPVEGFIIIGCIFVAALLMIVIVEIAEWN